MFIPDFFRGNSPRQGGERPEGSVVDGELLNSVVPFVKSNGVDILGMVGFCFVSLAPDETFILLTTPLHRY